MTEREELKPCPFCGVGIIKLKSGAGEFWCLCLCCGSSGSCTDTKEKAAQAWNRRAEG